MIRFGRGTLYLLNEYNRLAAIKTALRTTAQEDRLDTLGDWKQDYDDYMAKWQETPGKPIPAADKNRLERLSRATQSELK